MTFSFIWAIGLVALIALTYGVRAVLGYRNVMADAEADYIYKSKEDMIDSRLSREAYIRAYRRFYAPRGTAYVASAMGAILLLTYPTLVMIQFLLDKLWIASGRSVVVEPGFLVWQFMIFFSVIGLWAGIAYITARRFHRLTPISLEAEIEKELERTYR